MIDATMKARLEPRIVATSTQRRACEAQPGVSGAARADGDVAGRALRDDHASASLAATKPTMGGECDVRICIASVRDHGAKADFT